LNSPPEKALKALSSVLKRKSRKRVFSLRSNVGSATSPPVFDASGKPRRLARENPSSLEIKIKALLLYQEGLLQNIFLFRKMIKILSIKCSLVGTPRPHAPGKGFDVKPLSTPPAGLTQPCTAKKPFLF
jgi:hypothetical protein